MGFQPIFTVSSTRDHGFFRTLLRLPAMLAAIVVRCESYRCARGTVWQTPVHILADLLNQWHQK
jgi:hypothetical protein